MQNVKHTENIVCYVTVTDAELLLITSAEEGGYVFGLVCLSVYSVCLSVRQITRKLVNEF